MLTEQGYYLTRLFQPDPLRIQWPEQATPGAILDNVPPGMGGEDFGGSITLGSDGKLYLQAGKTAFWNIEVVGLETVKPLALGAVTIEAADISLAQPRCARTDLQSRRGQAAAVGEKADAEVHRQPGPRFPGHHDSGQIPKAGNDARVRARRPPGTIKNLYLGWEVFDSTPWVNGRTDRELMYMRRATRSTFSSATDPAANPRREPMPNAAICGYRSARSQKKTQRDASIAAWRMKSIPRSVQ